MVRWPVISIPLPEGPGIAVSVNYFDPLPVAPRGNTYILLFTDRVSGRSDMYAVTAAEFTAEGTAYQPVLPPLGMPVQHALGLRPPIFLKAFAGGLQAS